MQQSLLLQHRHHHPSLNSSPSLPPGDALKGFPAPTRDQVGKKPGPEAVAAWPTSPFPFLTLVPSVLFTEALGATEEALGATKEELGATEEVLGATEEALGATEKELGASEEALETTKEVLEAAEEALEAAEEALEAALYSGKQQVASW